MSYALTEHQFRFSLPQNDIYGLAIDLNSRSACHSWQQKQNEKKTPEMSDELHLVSVNFCTEYLRKKKNSCRYLIK